MVLTVECPQCHHQNPDDAEFCEQCGAELPAPIAVTTTGTTSAASVGAASPQAADNLVCPKCNAPFVPGDVFCFNCGTDLRNLPGNKQSAAAPPVSANPATATPSVQPATNLQAVQPPPTNDGMSGDDWDKAFDTPTASGPTTTSVTAQTPPIPATDTGANFAPAAPASGTTASAFSAPAQPTAVPTSSSNAAKNLTLSVTGPYGNQTVEYKGRELLLGRNDPKTRVFPDVNLNHSGGIPTTSFCLAGRR